MAFSSTVTFNYSSSNLTGLMICTLDVMLPITFVTFSFRNDFFYFLKFHTPTIILVLITFSYIVNNFRSYICFLSVTLNLQTRLHTA